MVSNQAQLLIICFFGGNKWTCNSTCTMFKKVHWIQRNVWMNLLKSSIFHPVEPLGSLTLSALLLEFPTSPAVQAGDIEVLSPSAALWVVKGEEKAAARAQGEHHQRRGKPSPQRRHGYSSLNPAHPIKSSLVGKAGLKLELRNARRVKKSQEYTGSLSPSLYLAK